MTLNHHHHPPPPPTQTQCLQYLSCYWPDFDQTLKVGSWDHLSQMPTVTVTFVQVTFFLETFVQATFVPATFVPSTIVHLRCYWPNFDQTFWPMFLQALIFMDPKFSRPTIVWRQNFLDPIFFLFRISLDSKFCWRKLSLESKMFWPKIIST